MAQENYTHWLTEEDGLPTTQRGLWGGLLIMGNAPASVEGGTTAQIEGIPATDPNGAYGGTDAADNSGVIKYVSIRFGGSNIGEGNEINGLTLGGVGIWYLIDLSMIIMGKFSDKKKTTKKVAYS